jgi:hypothetical protein
VLFSLGSLIWSSSKLFYSQRLGRYCQIDPPQKYLFFICFPIFLQNIGFLSAWILIAAYLQIYTTLCVLLVMAIVFFWLQLLVTGWQSLSSQSVEDIFDIEAKDKKLETERRIFATAVFTSWVVPCTVWSIKSDQETKDQNKNQIPNSRKSFKSLFKHLLLKARRKYSSCFLMDISFKHIWFVTQFWHVKSNPSYVQGLFP